MLVLYLNLSRQILEGVGGVGGGGGGVWLFVVVNAGGGWQQRVVVVVGGTQGSQGPKPVLSRRTVVQEILRINIANNGNVNLLHYGKKVIPINFNKK